LAKPEGRWVLVVSPARALCSSSRYRISGASIFQSHKTASNTASGGPSHHAKISHGGCGFHSGLGRTLRARISIPSLQDGSLGGAVRHSCQFDAPVFRSDSTLRGGHLNTQHVACCRLHRALPAIPRRQAAFRTPRCWHRFAPALTWVRLVVLEMGEGGAEWTSGPSRTFVRG
jgi:hypothetical protein